MPNQTPHYCAERNSSPRSTKRNAARVAIVNAAIAIGREAGTVNAVTMRALARRTRLSLPVLYQSFQDKQALVRAARGEAVQPLRRRLMVALDGGSDTSALIRWVECYVSADHRDPWLRGLLAPVRETMLPADLEEAAALIGLAPVQRVLGDLQAHGRLSSGVSPRLGSWLMWSGAHAVLMLRDAVERDCGAAEEIPLRRVAAAIVCSVVRDPVVDERRADASVT